jgi:hypothetical protein
MSRLPPRTELSPKERVYRTQQIIGRAIRWIRSPDGMGVLVQDEGDGVTLQLREIVDQKCPPSGVLIETIQIIEGSLREVDRDHCVPVGPEPIGERQALRFVVRRLDRDPLGSEALSKRDRRNTRECKDGSSSIDPGLAEREHPHEVPSADTRRGVRSEDQLPAT